MVGAPLFIYNTDRPNLFVMPRLILRKFSIEKTPEWRLNN
jgi:hypothetical protein